MFPKVCTVCRSSLSGLFKITIKFHYQIILENVAYIFHLWSLTDHRDISNTSENLKQINILNFI